MTNYPALKITEFRALNDNILEQTHGIFYKCVSPCQFNSVIYSIMSAK